MSDYAKACQFGRESAATALQSANLPKVLREMREAAADQTGWGAGYLTQIACTAMEREECK